MPALIHVDVEYGKVYTYFITIERVNVHQAVLSVPPKGKVYHYEDNLIFFPIGLYTLNLVDNLILINNLTEKRTCIYDIKKAAPAKPIGHAKTIQLRDLKIMHKRDELSSTLVEDESQMMRPGKKGSMSVEKRRPRDSESSGGKAQKRNDSGEKRIEMADQELLIEGNLEDYQNKPVVKAKEDSKFFCGKENKNV